jgi:hypothetical protein
LRERFERLCCGVSIIIGAEGEKYRERERERAGKAPLDMFFFSFSSRNLCVSRTRVSLSSDPSHRIDRDCYDENKEKKGKFNEKGKMARDVYVCVCAPPFLSTKATTTLAVLRRCIVVAVVIFITYYSL